MSLLGILYSLGVYKLVRAHIYIDKGMFTRWAQSISEALFAHILACSLLVVVLVLNKKKQE
jgi:hypothetical protein